MAIPDDALDRYPPQPYATVREEVRTGDLILCSGDSLFSRLIRWATKSPWSHVAIAFRDDSINRVMVVESVEKIGVRVVPLSAFLSQDSNGRKPYPGRLMLARHTTFTAQATPEAMKAMITFAFDRLGAPFDPREITRIGLRIAMGRLNLRMPKPLNPVNEYICSEFVAKCYDRVGIKIPWDGLGFIGPNDIADAPQVVAVAQIQRL